MFRAIGMLFEAITELANCVNILARTGTAVAEQFEAEQLCELAKKRALLTQQEELKEV